MARKAAEKQPRRKPGTGTIRERKAREKPFEACWTYPDGTQRYEPFQSRSAAAAWLDGLAKEKKDGTRDLLGGAMLVQDYLPMWLDLKKGHISPKTEEAYQYYCEYACGEGGLGRFRMDTVTALIGQRMVNRLATDGFQNTGQLKSVLFQAFEYAFDPLDYIKKNPFVKVKVPPIERKDGIALTKLERARMLSAAQLDDSAETMRRDDSDTSIAPRARPRTRSAPAPLLPFWHLTSRLAFRRGEASALKWEAVDLENAVITIGASRGRLGSTHIEGKTKTKKVRYAPLPLDLVEVLRTFKAEQMRAALRHGWRWSDKCYIFIDERTGLPLSVDHLRYRWGRIKAAAGLPIKMTIHDLRVTALTILALSGVPENVRMELAGHATEDMARHYANHASLEDVRRALG